MPGDFRDETAAWPGGPLTPPTRDRPEGRLSPGPPPGLVEVAGFRLERELGRGGVGVVYLARRGDGPPVALKLLLELSAEAVQRVLREGRNLLRLDHPGIVRGVEVGPTEHGPYVAMELVDGEPLSSRLRRGPIDVA